MAEWVLALDIGGTKLAAGLVRLDGSVVHHDSAQTNGRGTAEALYADVIALCERVLAAGGVSDAELVVVGVGCGGPMLSPEERVSPLNIPSWSGFPLRERL